VKLIKRKAFSLVEISIVILIIAILIAGISQAVEMFSEASIKSARNLSKLSRVSRIEDLTLWLDATSSEAFDKEKDDNSKISIWKDTNAAAASIISSSSSSASLYPSYALSAINKLPAVSFKKTSSLVGNCVTVPNGSFVNSFEDFTLYLIFNPKNLDDGIIIEKNNASATKFPFSLELLSGSYKFSVKNSTSTISVTGARQPQINTPNLIRLSRIKGSQIEIAIDGVSSTETDTLFTSSTLNNAELAIGCRIGSTPANFINGDIGETAFYNRNLNSKDKSDVEEYLYKKWKMKKFEGTLPAITTPAPVITCTVPNANTNSDGNSVDFTTNATSLNCKTGFTGSPSYTCTGATNPGTYTSGGTACTATTNTCTVTAGTGYSQQSKSGSGTFPCDVAGYTGTISYSCTTNLATVAGTGSCTVNSCTVTAGTGYTTKTLLPVGSDSFPCDAGYEGTINYNCPSSGGTATKSGSCTASPIKCYAIDILGFRGTNYLDTVVIDADSQDIMYANIDDTRIHSAGQSAMLLPLVNRLKLYDVYHGSLSYQSGDVVWANYGAIDMSKFPQTSYTSAIKQYGSPGNFDIYGTHELTKYARTLGYGTNTFTCDYGFTGTLTYNCTVDGSTLLPTSGTCIQN
jgi:prepilin-type N-terminal cleavage/methylation domain-containing protein